MTARIIDGDEVAASVSGELTQRIANLTKRGVRPGLVVVLVGDDAASISYVRGKERDCAQLGIYSETLRPPADISQESLLGLIADLNRDARFHGILVQLPLPAGLDASVATEAVAPAKDVDGLHPVNLGKLLRGDGVLLPCTASGIQQMLIRTGHEVSGKHVVICGRGNLVGRPLASLLMQKGPGGDATVTVCHTATPELASWTRRADVLVVGIGRPRAITREMVKPGAVVIDAGVNRIPDSGKKAGWRLVGDVDFEAVREVVSAITPVPRGVGSMTRMMLMANTVMATEQTCAGILKA